MQFPTTDTQESKVKTTFGLGHEDLQQDFGPEILLTYKAPQA